MNPRKTIRSCLFSILEKCHDEFTHHQLSVIREHLIYSYSAGYDMGRKANSNPKAVLQIKDGQTINRFESAAEAARNLRCTKSSISKAANGVTQHCRGFQWKYEN